MQDILIAVQSHSEIFLSIFQHAILLYEIIRIWLHIRSIFTKLLDSDPDQHIKCGSGSKLQKRFLFEKKHPNKFFKQLFSLFRSLKMCLQQCKTVKKMMQKTRAKVTVLNFSNTRKIWSIVSFQIARSESGSVTNEYECKTLFYKHRQSLENH